MDYLSTGYFTKISVVIAKFPDVSLISEHNVSLDC
jgi:hypothetical protein